MIKTKLKNNLQDFSNNNLLKNSLDLFTTLGYTTKRQIIVSSIEDFRNRFLTETFNEEKALFSEWTNVQFLFELQPDDLNSDEPEITGGKVGDKVIEAYWFIAIELLGDNYTKKQLSEITREVNRQIFVPTFILFKYSDKLTFSIIDRRINKKDDSRDVLEKVVLIKDINYADPHRAHIEILNDIVFENLKVENFLDLHLNWLKALSVSELNKRFYTELSNWFFWTMDTCQLSKDNTVKDNVMFGIRMVTRIIFDWFIKEKGLVSEKIFDKQTYLDLLKPEYKEQGDLYYKVVLQNLFFGCLSKPMDRREFRSETSFQGKNKGYDVNNLFRYAKYLNNPQDVVNLFKDIPFLNGGLFECTDEKRAGKYIDCFTDTESKNFLKISDDIFFLEDEKIVDLSAHFDGNNSYKNAKVKGLFAILKKYKFTIDETTPVEEEIALDPELLGRVFENLLAAHNPETKTTARKSTGSYYTPREIVDYMCEQSLTNYLKTKVERSNIEDIDEKLKELLSYSETHSFNETEVDELIKAVNKVKILDPACGSGAFPMGLLHKLVHVLSKLDPHNEKWKESQIEKASQIDDMEAREEAINIIEKQFNDNEMDYSRKLYLIQNCIFGVDIQPMATQISRLRFFISLIVDEKPNKSKPNMGILALPNLETKFVAANTLIDINEDNLFAQAPSIIVFKQELEKIRNNYFRANSSKKKVELQNKDKEIREKIRQEAVLLNFDLEQAAKLADWSPYDKDKSSEWFNPKWMFDVDKFDIIIANPPYLKERDHKDIFEPVNKSNFGKKYHQGKMDFWYYFLHKAIKLSKNNGSISFITSRYWLNGSGAKKLINDVKENLSFIDFVDIGKLKVFDNVAGYHMVATYKKNTEDPNIEKFDYHKLENDVRYINQPDDNENKKSLLLSNKKIYVNDEIILEPISKYKIETVPLSKECIVVQGVVQNPDKINKKNANEYGFDVNSGVFVLTNKELERLHLREDEKKFVKVFLEENSINKYYINDQINKKYLLYITKENCTNIDNYPNIKTHLSRYKVIMDKRRETLNGSNSWFHLHWPRKREYFEQEKLVIPSMFEINTVGYDTNNCYFGMSSNLISMRINSDYSLKTILAILNSKFALNWFYKNGKKRGTGVDIGVAKLESFPLPKKIKKQDNIIEIVEKIITIIQDANLKIGDLQKQDINNLEKQIDIIVYKLYDLTYSEVKTIDPSFSMSEKEYNEFTI